MKCIAQIDITPQEVLLNGSPLEIDSVGETPDGKAFLTAYYKKYIGDYPKYYKMDPLARLGFIASELLIQAVDKERFVDREDRAVVLVNRSASLAADQKYETTIVAGDNYFPSPGDFVYTLPNIVTGEIALRNHYYGETNFMVINENCESLVQSLIAQAFGDDQTNSVLGGWLECKDINTFDAHLGIYERD